MRERRDVGPNHMYGIEIVAQLRTPFDREVGSEEVSQPVDSHEPHGVIRGLAPTLSTQGYRGDVIGTMTDAREILSAAFRSA